MPIEARLAAARSLLYVPGDDARRLARAWGSPADAVVADLEDAVLPGRKKLARDLVLASLPVAGPLKVVRINSLDTEWGADDLAALHDVQVDALVVPKATVQTLPPESPPVIALIETAAGLRQAYDIACHSNVYALALGAADLGAELGWHPRTDGLELLHARSTLVLDSAAAGIRPPYDAVHLATQDPAGLRAEAQIARSLGLGGKQCIHPAQVDVVNGTFSPSREEIHAAQEMLDAFATAGSAVTVVRGKLVDAPVAARARALLRAAEALKL